QPVRELDLVAVDPGDALTAALRSLLAELIRLLLARAECVGALPQRDHLQPPALAIGEADRALPAGQLARLRKCLLARLDNALIDAVGRSLERADPRRLRPLAALLDRDLVRLDRGAAPAHLRRELLRHVFERLLGVANRLLAVEESDAERGTALAVEEPEEPPRIRNRARAAFPHPRDQLIREVRIAALKARNA